MYMRHDQSHVYYKLHPIMITKAELLALVPDVQPRKAWRSLDLVYQGTSEPNMDTFQWDCELIRETLRWGSDRKSRYVSPLLAAVMVRLFDMGLIPQAKKSSSKQIDGLRAYAARGPAFLEAAAQAYEQYYAYLKRIALVAGDLSLGRADEISRAFINDVIIECKGPGRSGSIVIDGVQCYKVRCGGPVATSGKSRGLVPFNIHWIDSDGIRHGDPDTDLALSKN